MTRRTLPLEPGQRQALTEYRDHDPRPFVRERCAALLKVADGQAPYAVARHGLLRPRDPDTVYHWLALYQDEGLDGLIAHTHGGNRRHPFDRREELVDRLRQGPGDEARRETAPTPAGPPPARWTLRAIRATFDWLSGYTLGGVWRLLGRCGLGVRGARAQQFSPDPGYAAKLARLRRVLRAAATDPRHVVVVFWDEMGYTRWPDPGTDWGPLAPAAAPVADRCGSDNGLWRLIGALNARTGRVDSLDGYVVGRAKVIAMYRKLSGAYPRARRIYVVQDNWSIHKHPEVVAALRTVPRIRPVWLPTYAPWLNPIEKLWRWLRQAVLRQHRLAADWPRLRERVNGFLGQFAHGSRALLRYAGLLGDGRLARWLRPP
jgi:transposase